MPTTAASARFPSAARVHCRVAARIEGPQRRSDIVAREMSPADAVHVKLPDGSQREYPRGVTGAEIALSIGKRLAQDAIAAKVDGEWVDLDRPVDHDTSATTLPPPTPHPPHQLPHS